MRWRMCQAATLSPDPGRWITRDRARVVSTRKAACTEPQLPDAGGLGGVTGAAAAVAAAAADAATDADSVATASRAAWSAAVSSDPLLAIWAWRAWIWESRLAMPEEMLNRLAVAASRLAFTAANSVAMVLMVLWIRLRHFRIALWVKGPVFMLCQWVPVAGADCGVTATGGAELVMKFTESSMPRATCCT